MKNGSFCDKKAKGSSIMEIQNQPTGDTAVVEIAGKVTIGHDAKMRDAILDAADAGARNILLKMDRVTKIDSSGIGELAAAHRRIKDAGGRFLLVGLSEKLAAPLIIANLMGILETYPNVEEALAALDITEE
jgi:anti-sigma B factor antagonist